MMRAHLFPLALLLAQCVAAFLAVAALTDTTTDESALLVLKSRLTIDPSHILSRNWSASTSVCSWIGVTCGSRHRRVTALDISKMELTGNLPPDIGNLTFLVSMNLSSNSFYGSLPRELDQLRRLEVIDFRFNSFSGDVPSWFGLLAELQFLNLRNNSFSGFGPASIANMSKLETLDLSYNSLQGKIPDEIGNLHNLKMLSLQFNKFDGLIPMTIFNISSLESLALTGNRLSGDLPGDLCHFLPRLNELYLSSNELDGWIPSSISQCSQLRLLSLSHNKFSGSVPSGIGNLTALEILYIGSNDLTGQIPEELGKLQNLKELGMGDNFLRGSIPSTIFNISSLQYVNIANCNLTGALPADMCSGSSQLQAVYFHVNELVGELPESIGECSALQIWSLSYNNITGIIPRGVGNLTMLQTFYVGYNNLIGTIPKEIGNLQSLEVLYLGVNSLRGSIPREIFNISTLRMISISMNQLSGQLPSNLRYGLPNLEEIYLNNNNLSGEIPDSVSNSSKLTIVNFGDNYFTGLVPNSLGELSFLQELYLGGNSFVSKSSELMFIPSLTNCRQLRKLDLGDNLFNGVLPVSVGNLSNSLEYFYGYNCGLHGSIPNEFGNLTNLLILSLFGNQLTGSIPMTLVNLKKLQGLALMRNRISGSIPDTLCRLQSLNGILLHQNQISGAIPGCIGNLTALRSLYIGNNNLNSGIPPSLWLLNDLLQLNLTSNVLVGSLPPDIGNLKAATMLDLSMNQFSGIIPPSVGDLYSLINLSLAHNRFEGSIPESLGELVNLAELDLSHNNLSGNIPRSLEGLPYVTYFDVSFNDLSGEIPTGGPFKNFGSQAFVSNGGGLCGDPRYALVFFLVLAYVFIRYRRKKIPAAETQNELSSDATPLRASYNDLLQATEGFNSSHLLGTGGFSSVYKGTLRNRETVAIKVFNSQQEGAFKSFDRECEVLRSLRHRNLCKVIGACSNEHFKALLLEYMPNGSLEKWLYSDDDRFLDIMQRTSIMIDVACALEYLHHGYSIPIVHCDVKPSNVLLDNDTVGRLSDFGIAKLLGEDDSFVQTTTFATLGYIAPEYGSEGLVSIKSDVYSFGIMLMEVFTRMRPSSETFAGDLSLRGWVKSTMPNAVARIIDPGLLKPEEENVDERLKCLSSIMELALKCSMESPGERISMEDVVVALKKIKFKLLQYFP
ncbi:putative LRR receptor-like serine/threonine-protein kinase [Sesamum alatum]|uniref:non-specific serine/threonine protein kinase n=1 Tax=Sesamum alatum TaxID=300844 RepID=A0AAE1YMH4_9LAMI|nr:putative LRR receptor-like serine/threonine-protein kinase [Sesamum alatum]